MSRAQNIKRNDFKPGVLLPGLGLYHVFLGFSSQNLGF